jgi:hypothetical protein
VVIKGVAHRVAVAKRVSSVQNKVFFFIIVCLSDFF